jgi:chromosome segregation protein
MLKSLELFGFKSFAERTLFEFAHGVTCVVGPNGSGKSNVVDSIKWILGDQSAKSLRGKEMSDVIFNGSTSRKPSQFAEATLTFDNAKGILPLDAREIQIGRRLYRSGDSEYLLNGNVVRLKDVRDLLLGTGAGTAAYSIIEQGRVDQILQSNPVSRRQVFEEAAGISRYKAKKVDAERRLERVAQNLLRLTDIVDEIESQLNATRSQASKAAKFRELSQELRTLWIGLAADDSAAWTVERECVETTRIAAQSLAESIEQKLAAIEENRRGIEGELATSDQQIREVEQQIATLRQAIATSTADMRHQSQRSDELSAEIEQLQAQQVSLTADAALAERELAEAGDRLTRLEASLAERRIAFDERDRLAVDVKTKLVTARRDALAQRTSRDELIDSLDQQQRKLASLQSQEASAVESQAELTSRREESQRRFDTANQFTDEARAEWAEIDAAASEASAARDAIIQERARLSQELTALECELNQRREQRTTWHARLRMLQEWESNQGGLGVGIREILDRAADATDDPWQTVRGIVGGLLEAPLEYAPVIDLALGDRAQAIVVDRMEPWFEHWAEGHSAAARISFISLEEQESEEMDAASIRRMVGVIARADEVVTEADGTNGLATKLLSRTWIVDSLRTALKVLQEVGDTCACVTLQGELLQSDGRLTVGPPGGESAVVSRRSELRQLTLDLKRLDRTIESETRRLADLTAVHVARDSAVHDADAAFREQLDRASSAKAILEVKDEEQRRFANELVQLDEQLRTITTRKLSIESQLSELKQGIAVLEEDIDRAAATVNALEREIEYVDHELRSLTEELDRERIELAKQEERQRSLKDSQERFVRDQAVRVRQEREAVARLGQSREAHSRAQLAVLAASAHVSSLTAEVERFQSQLIRLEDDRRDVRAKRHVLLKEEDTARKQRHAVVDDIHRAELQIREINQQFAALEQRMQEEYQLTLADIAATGASAYSQYLAAHGHGVGPVGDPNENAQPESADGEAVEGASEIVEAAAWTGAPPAFAEIRPELEGQVERLRRRIKALGHVNTDALNDLDELENRFADLSGQLHDLQEAKTSLEDIIRRINIESRKLFMETFEAIRLHFRELFRKLFGGGEGEIVLENPEDVLECGIDIVARPPGKELRSISLLSGGEKTLTAIALLFAMFKSKPSPYCILDEVDAALDEANVERYAGIIRDFVHMTQFVVITHRKRTMTAADALYGVTMEQAGISKRMSVRFEEVGEHGEILGNAKARAA